MKDALGETIATTESVSCIVAFGRTMKQAIGEVSPIGLTGYRILSYLEQNRDGATPGDLAHVTKLSPGTISSSLNRLFDDGYIVKEGLGGIASYRTIITDSGLAHLPTCDEAILEAYDSFFEPLNESLKANLLSGSLVTTSFLGVTRMIGDRYFPEYSVLIGFLNSELHFTNTARLFGLGLGEYRVLLLLKEHPSVSSQKGMRRILLAHPSELSTWCRQLQEKGLITAKRNPSDRRSTSLAATAEGLLLADKIKAAVGFDMVRPTHAGEAPLYNGMLRIIMDHRRAE